MGRNILNRADAHGAEGKTDAKLFCSPRGKYLAVGMLHSGHASRRNRHRHFDGDTQHLRRGAAPVHIDRNALAQLDLLKIVRIGPVGALGPAAAIGVVVKHPGHTPLGQYTQVFDCCNDRHSNSGSSGVSPNIPR